MRRFAISDIHGCLKTFQALLERIAFSKADILYLLCDYIDRGPDSRGLIDYIWKLKEAGYTMPCLRGNHEQMLLDEVANPNDWFRGEPETLRSFGVRSNSGIPGRYLY